MKIAKILSASVIAGVILLSGTACAQPFGGGTGGNVPERSPSASSTTGIEESSEAEMEEVSTTVNGYYGFIAQPETFNEVRDAGAELTGRSVTDQELQDLASGYYGFSYFDISSSQAIKNAYKSMQLGANAGYEREGITIHAPSEGITIDGDTATFNTTHIVLTENGKTFPSEPEANPDQAEMMNLAKQDDGSWVIVAKSSGAKVTAP